MSRGDRLLVRELTPRGVGGVSVIAVEGHGAWARVRELVPALDAPSAVPRLVKLACGGELLDEALALVESRERVELHVHGSPPLVRRLIEVLGAREVDAAVTLEERAAKLLAHAPCDAASRILLDQSEGALRRELEAILHLERGEARARLGALRESSHRASFALEPRTVVLAGPVNAGKSTLFNALYGQRRVIVSAQPGTTRDVVGERVLFGAWPVDLFDTAGERGASSAVEREGQSLARDVRARAQLVLWLQPVDGKPVAPDTNARTRVVLTHADTLADATVRLPRITALHRPTEAVEVVHTVFREAFSLEREAWRAGEPVAFDARCRAALANASEWDSWREPLRELLAEG